MLKSWGSDSNNATMWDGPKKPEFKQFLHLEDLLDSGIKCFYLMRHGDMLSICIKSTIKSLFLNLFIL